MLIHNEDEAVISLALSKQQQRPNSGNLQTGVERNTEVL